MNAARTPVAHATMHDIDFLPAQCRLADARRRRGIQTLVALVLLVPLLGIAASMQWRHQAGLEADLAALRAQRQAAEALNTRLATLQSQLQAAQAEAELVTYLHHPWPRTRILAALLEPLPEVIQWEQLECRDEAFSEPASQNPYAGNKKSEEELAAALSPAAQALAQLRDQYDRKQTVVTVTGWTQDAAAMHRYLEDVRASGLFQRVELDVLESDPTSAQRGQHFTATMVVRPGYGQPGGPVGPSPGDSFLHVLATRDSPETLCLRATTNLPDGALVRVSLRPVVPSAGPDAATAEELLGTTLTVSGGQLNAQLPLPGSLWQVSAEPGTPQADSKGVLGRGTLARVCLVLTFSPDQGQPASVVKQVGSRGERLSGPEVVQSGARRMLRVEQQIVLHRSFSPLPSNPPQA